jgi:hypothetical protein
MKQTAYYRTKDGQSDYLFSFEKQPDGTWLAFILKQPSYGNRATDNHSTHRLQEGDRDYVCWTDPLETKEQAKAVAALWADATQEYIKNGTRF